MILYNICNKSIVTFSVQAIYDIDSCIETTLLYVGIRYLWEDIDFISIIFISLYKGNDFKL